MKHLKTLALAGLATAALMALAGVGTASADELCTTTAVNNMCPAGSLITTTEESAVGTIKLKTTGGTVLTTCSAAVRHSGTIDQGTGTRPVKKTNMSWGFAGCNGTVDTVTGGTFTAEEGAGGGTTLTSIGVEWTTELFGVSCTYGTGTGVDLGEMNTAGEQPEFNVTVSKLAGGALCPASAKWEGAWKLTNHNALHYIKN